MLDYLDQPGSEPVKMLFTGHVGSGKSTELNKLIEDLGDRFFVVKVRTNNVVSPTDLTCIDIILVAAMSLFREATDARIVAKAPAQIVEGVWTEIAQFVDGVIFGKVPYRKPLSVTETGVKIGSPAIVQGLAVEFEARFKSEMNTRDQIRSEMRDRLSEVIARMNLLSAEVQHRYRRPVLFVFDDTDKPDVARAADIFFDHPQTLTGFNASVIYTFPIALRYSRKYSDVDRYFRDFRMPNLVLVNRDGSPNPAGKQVMDLALARRMQSPLIDPAASDRLIQASGGLMRNLIGLVQEAASNARGRGAERIELPDAGYAIADLRKDFEAQLRSDDYSYLAARHTDKWLSSDEKLQELLQIRALLEYENGEMWCDVHPVALSLVEKRAGHLPPA